MLQGKKIVIGVCGSIAAYKSAYLLRLLIKAGAEVQVICTESAKAFITPLTLSTLSKNPVLSAYYDKKTGEWSNHVDLGRSADILLIAPASANTIGKAAAGLCDNLLTAVYLSAACPVIWAPAMDLEMYQHPSVKANIAKLQAAGDRLIAPEEGELASGLVGEGRMAEPENILIFLEGIFSVKNELKGKKALVTAGPTYEPIDPVRYIGNRSSGKTGFAVAESLARHGADVTLITGPTSETLKNPSVNLKKVTSADEMYAEAKKHFLKTDIAVFTAAVSDYAPEKSFSEKIKKKTDTLTLALKKNPDIAAEFGKKKKKKAVSVGFALETEKGTENAKAKIRSKQFDLIVLNSPSKNSGFEHDTNKVTFIDADNKITTFELKLKTELAEDITRKIVELLNA